MKTEILRELKEHCEFAIKHQHFIPQTDSKLVLELVDREIKKLESRQKVKLLPCRCGSESVFIMFDYDKETNTVNRYYKCRSCYVQSEPKYKDRDARLAWNKGAENGKYIHV